MLLAESQKPRPWTCFVAIWAMRWNGALATELVKGSAHGSAGYLDEPVVGLVHLNNQKERSCHRQRTDEQRHEYAAVTRRKQAKAAKNHCEPKNQNSQERPLNSASGLLKHQPASFRNFSRDLQRRGLEPPLSIILRGKLKQVALNFLNGRTLADGLRRHLPIALLRPDLVDSHCKNLAKRTAKFARLRAILGHGAIKQNSVRRHAPHFGVFAIE